MHILNMKVRVKVHTSSSQEKIIEIGNGSIEVWLKQKAIDNKDNLELIKVLKKYFKKNIKIKTGFTSKNKIIEVN